MSSRKDEGPIESPGPIPDDDPPCPSPPPNDGGPIGTTRGGFYSELHGDVRKGQKPPPEEELY